MGLYSSGGDLLVVQLPLTFLRSVIEWHIERTTTDVWTYGDQSTVGADMVGDVDLTGSSVEALDGGIGKIDEASYDVGASFIVVDTGPWISGKKVMLPAGIIKRVDVEDETVHVDRTRSR